MDQKINPAFFIYGEAEENPMPHGWQRNIDSFKAFNSDQFKVKNISLGTCENNHEEVFRWCKIAWAQLMRFKKVYEEGGLYSDCDIEYYGKIPNINDCDHVFATEIHGHVSDAFFYAKKGSEIIEEAYHKTVGWIDAKMNSGDLECFVQEFMDSVSVGMFSSLVKRATGMNFINNKQVHMSQEEFGGKFHPESGVGIVPFEVLCRHSRFNWIGWHQCNGTWRPRSHGDVSMRPEAKIRFNKL